MCDDLGTKSVVMIARAVAEFALGSLASLGASFSIPDSIFSMGSMWPIMPVEQTSTSAGSMPSCSPVCKHMVSASARPCWPVQTLEIPELHTIACALPLRTCRLETTTGAPGILLVVNTPAAAQVESEVMIIRSGFPEALMPQVIPPVRKPFAAVMLDKFAMVLLNDYKVEVLQCLQKMLFMV